MFYAIIEYDCQFINVADFIVDPDQAVEMVNKRYGYELDWEEVEEGFLAHEEKVAVLSSRGWMREPGDVA